MSELSPTVNKVILLQRMNSRLKLPKLSRKLYPTLVKYPPEMIEEAVQKLVERHKMTVVQALQNLELDLSSI